MSCTEHSYHKDTIFETYTIQSASENNTINLRVPLAALHRALRSALSASSASIRLTKKDDIPLLSLTIITSNLTAGRAPHPIATTTTSLDAFPSEFGADETFGDPDPPRHFDHDREMTITQDVPVVVLAPASVASINEPQGPTPDVHIMLPSLLQLKAISERLTKLALSTSSSSSSSSFGGTGSRAGSRLADTPSSQSRLILSANAHGGLKIGVETSALKIESRWEGLSNPELDPELNGGEDRVMEHPSTRMKEMEGEAAWSTVRVEGRDWGRVLGVGRLGGRVVACTSVRPSVLCQSTRLVLILLFQQAPQRPLVKLFTY